MQQVIAYMTLGMDVSSLFSEMIKVYFLVFSIITVEGYLSKYLLAYGRNEMLHFVNNKGHLSTEELLFAVYEYSWL